ncbi:MAG: hypothetical protein JXA77_15255 [Bacteroidales bacterium]|nr:hypothetical protein [Bacteroidales bacterium]MBN2820225.1 hypothetical protein [Bacteroidales bacterium]
MDNEFDIDYLQGCLRMTPEERMKKGFELSEWAISLNRWHKEQLERDLETGFVLR